MQEQTTVPYLRSDGTPNVCRHPCNDRAEEQTFELLAASIEDRGALLGVRGQPWLVQPQGDGPMKLLSWGTWPRPALHASVGLLILALRCEGVFG